MLLFSQKLRYLRESSSETQTVLAETLGLTSPAHLSHLEAGRKVPSLSLVLRIASLFQVTLDYLLLDSIPVLDVRYRMNNFPIAKGDHVFARQLRRLRKACKLTQLQLAQELGLKTQSHISLLETQRSEPSLELTIQLADVLGVAIEELFINPESGNPDL